LQDQRSSFKGKVRQFATVLVFSASSRETSPLKNEALGGFPKGYAERNRLRLHHISNFRFRMFVLDKDGVYVKLEVEIPVRRKGRPKR
jgi:hypothetical protein